jgi:hypothetical protein
MRKLHTDGFPRLQMSFFAIVTGASGMAASYVLLRSGVLSMPARYLLSVGFAYLVFLFLLWLWLRTKTDDYLDVSFDIPSPTTGHSADTGHTCDISGGGGQFGGGGASGRFDFDDSLPSPPQLDIPFGDSVGDAVGEVVGGADEGAIPLAIALLIAALAAAFLFSALYIVYLAPALFAELLVDGVLSASLYRRMRGLQTRHWLESAVRRTLVPFGVTALSLAAIGFAFNLYAPEAHTLGEVLRHYGQV